MKPGDRSLEKEGYFLNDEVAAEVTRDVGIAAGWQSERGMQGGAQTACEHRSLV